MLQIVKIKYIPLPLCLPVKIVKFLYHIKERFNHRSSPCHRLCRFFWTLKAKAFPAFFNQLFHLGPTFLYILLFILVNGLVSGRCQTDKLHSLKGFIKLLKGSSFRRLLNS